MTSKARVRVVRTCGQDGNQVDLVLVPSRHTGDRCAIQ